MIVMVVVIALVLVLALVTAGLWQHRRYLRTRRTIVRDRQPMLYPGTTFHVLTFVKVGANEPVVDELRGLCHAIGGVGGGLVVYAGQTGPAVVTSEQIPGDWSGLVLAQYPSRAAYERFSESDVYRAALARFEESYSHGAVRSAVVNLAIPVGLLMLRFVDRLRMAPSSFPLVPAGEGATPRQAAKMKELEQLDALRGISEDAVVIFNLIKPGNAQQRSADRRYALQMMRAMAEGGYGPMHMGRAVTLEGDAEFVQFAAVYYPGITFLQTLIGSTFMSQIGGDKQLGDSLAVPTVPIALD